MDSPKETVANKDLDVNFGEAVTKLCYEHYNKVLPRFGKCGAGKEGVHVAAFIMSKRKDSGGGEYGQLRVVSMATGSKCIGRNSMSPKGAVVNDSHAEVLSRRALLRFLYHHLHLALMDPGTSEVLEFSSCRRSFILKPGICFHLFSNCVPCGDAAIFPKISNTDDDDAVKPNKRLKTSSGFRDIYRTGAKCCGEGPQDPYQAGENYHVLGALRTKPGRGDPTLSMSCSDKIARWNVVGLQGALLSLFIPSPIFIKTITIASDRCNLEALRRAVVSRVQHLSDDLSQSYSVNSEVQLLHSCSQQHLTAEADAKPSPTALVWSDVSSRPMEVIVNGFKQGATDKLVALNSPKIRCAVSKYEIFKEFQSLQARFNKVSEIRDTEYLSKNYAQCKLASLKYQQVKTCLLTSVFSAWTKKPEHMQRFHLDSTDLDSLHRVSSSHQRSNCTSQQ